MNKIENTFLGCESNYDDAEIVVFGAPFDSTTSNRPGTRYASRNMRMESVYGMETYSPYQDKDLTDFLINDGGDLELPFGNAKKTLEIIENLTDEIVADGKKPLMIGGEHLLTLGTVKALIKKYPDLAIIHFDAHADVRQEILGEELSHGTVMKRIWDLLGDNSIFQFGIRSGTKQEFVWCKEHIKTNKFNFDGLAETVKALNGKPVYLSIDLDVLDPSIFPGTGTPEAGGVSFKELLDAILEVTKLDMVGMDIMELSPALDQSGSSTTVACKILRESLLAMAKNKKIIYF